MFKRAPRLGSGDSGVRNCATVAKFIDTWHHTLDLAIRVFESVQLLRCSSASLHHAWVLTASGVAGKGRGSGRDGTGRDGPADSLFTLSITLACASQNVVGIWPAGNERPAECGRLAVVGDMRWAASPAHSWSSPRHRFVPRDAWEPPRRSLQLVYRKLSVEQGHAAQKPIDYKQSAQQHTIK